MKAKVIRESGSFPMGLIVDVIREIDQYTLYVKSREVARAIPKSDVNIIKETK